MPKTLLGTVERRVGICSFCPTAVTPLIESLISRGTVNIQSDGDGGIALGHVSHAERSWSEVLRAMAGLFQNAMFPMSKILPLPILLLIIV